MNYYFISDDRYFLDGIREMPLYRERRVSLIHAGGGAGNLAPAFGDIVVVNVADIRMRARILRHPEMCLCRVIILLRMNMTGNVSAGGEFPWIFPDNMSAEALTAGLTQAGSTSVIHKDITECERWLFHYLGRGYSHAFLVSEMNLSDKYLYDLKIRAMKKYGLPGYHSAGVLLCRDITGMRQPGKYQSVRYYTTRRYPADRRRA